MMTPDLNTPYQPIAADFLPLASSPDSAPLQPAGAYWQEVWQRLRRNTGAMFALCTILALVLFSVLGPSLWPVDPGRQLLDQISQSPNLGRSALLVGDDAPWQGISVTPLASQSGELGAPASMRRIGMPNTEGVRIAWTRVPGASAYAVYRHELRPRDIHDLGLPLGVVGANHPAFEDRLALEARRYVYSVVALHDAQESSHYQSLELFVTQAITFASASARGLLSAQATPASAGKQLRLEAHPLGTDHLGRDMLARIISGSRTSLFVGICAPILFTLIALIYGGIAGYCGGRIDNWLMRFADFVLALPFLLFMILLRVAFGIGPGESGILPLMLALILLSWPAPARLVRAEVLRQRNHGYVEAARLMGAGSSYLILRHLLPNSLGVVLVSVSFAIPAAIFTEAFLSFIGLGVVPPNPSWGSMCNDGMRSMLAHPHEMLFPAAFIAITVLAFNVLGDGLRDAMDMRTRSE